MPLYITLTKNGTTSFISNTILVLNLSNSDLNQIKRRSLLANDENTTYLSFVETAVKDTSKNRIEAIPSTDATKVNIYTNDTTPPELLSFNLDLNLGQLILRFSETVDASTLNTGSLTISDVCPRVDFFEFLNITSNSTTSTAVYTVPNTNYTLTGN